MLVVLHLVLLQISLKCVASFLQSRKAGEELLSVEVLLEAAIDIRQGACLFTSRYFSGGMSSFFVPCSPVNSSRDKSDADRSVATTHILS